MTRAHSVAARFYRSLLFLYPAEFRREFGNEMARDFDEASREAWHAGGWPGLVALDIWITADLLTAVVRQWIRAGSPTLVLVSSTVVVASASAMTQAAVARAVLQGRMRHPVVPPTSSRISDMFSTTTLAVALLIIAATIIFTLWSAHAPWRRHRL